MILRSLVATFVLPSVFAFYVPGTAPRNWNPGEKVPVYVNSLSAQVVPGSSQLKSLIQYDYYDDRFGFCKPKDPPKKQSESLGSVLFGDRLYDSPFEIYMLKNTTCKPLCNSQITAKQSDWLADRIRASYAMNWLIDGLPASELKVDRSTGQAFNSMGFAMGGAALKQPQNKNVDDTKDWWTEIYNHYDIYLDYHSPDSGDHERIVGVVVEPRSIDSLKGKTDGTPDCATAGNLVVQRGEPATIPYTYSVIWRASKTPWATRWDVYLRVFDSRIHILSLVNSLIIAMFLCGMVAMVLLRTVHRDIDRYNAIDLDDDVQEDFGWKLVHGEVFRPPKKRMFLAVAVGTGIQLGMMAVVTLVFALLGLLAPSNRGALSNVMIVCWTFFGFFAGYVSSRLYATLRGEEWRKNIAITTLLFPTFLFGFLVLLNFFLIGAGSSGAIPFGTFIAILFITFLINAPLTLIGAWRGVRRGPVAFPVRVNTIPRQIPKVGWWLRPWGGALLAGVLPFASAFIEVYFILQSLFGAKVYYAFGFLALSSVVVVATTAMTSVLWTYFALCAEEYRWQWRSFLAGGGSAFWLIIYGLLYWATRLHLDGFANKVLYLGYLFLISMLVFLINGAVGFLATFAFLRIIYSRIRVD